MSTPLPGPLAVCPRSLSSHDGFRQRVADAGIDARWNNGGQRLRGDALHAFLDGAAAAVVGLEEPGGPPESVRVIAKYGVGLDSLDLDALEAAGVRVGWTPGVNRHAVAELAIALILACFRGLGAAQGPMRSGALADGRWRPPAGRQLRGSTVGVIGCGHAGREVVRLAEALGARVLVCDVRNRRDALPRTVKQVSFDEILAASGVLSLHVPLDPSTRGLLNAPALARLPRGAVVINTARGGLVDEDALLASLDAGHIAGAGLDVAVDEPVAPGPLLDHPGVVLTPHVGGSTRTSIDAMADAAWANLQQPQSVADLRARLAAGRIEPWTG